MCSPESLMIRTGMKPHLFVSDLQDPKLSPKQRLACKLRTEEKRIVSGTMDGVSLVVHVCCHELGLMLV